MGSNADDSIRIKGREKGQHWLQPHTGQHITSLYNSVCWVFVLVWAFRTRYLVKNHSTINSIQQTKLNIFDLIRQVKICQIKVYRSNVFNLLDWHWVLEFTKHDVSQYFLWLLWCLAQYIEQRHNELCSDTQVVRILLMWQ